MIYGIHKIRVVPGISRDPGMISMRRGKIPGIPGNRQISRDPDIDPGIPGFFHKGSLQRNLNPGIPGSDPGSRDDLHERGKDPGSRDPGIGNATLMQTYRSSRATVANL